MRTLFFCAIWLLTCAVYSTDTTSLNHDSAAIVTAGKHFKKAEIKAYVSAALTSASGLIVLAAPGSDQVLVDPVTKVPYVDQSRRIPYYIFGGIVAAIGTVEAVLSLVELHRGIDAMVHRKY